MKHHTVFTDSSEKDVRKSDLRKKCPFTNHYEQLLRNGHYFRVDKTMEENRPKDSWLNMRAVNSSSHINHLEGSEVGVGTMLHAAILRPARG